MASISDIISTICYQNIIMPSYGSDQKYHLTYSYLSSVPSYYKNPEQDVPGFSPVLDGMKSGIENSFSYYEEIANLKFDLVADNGDIKLGQCITAGAAGTNPPVAHQDEFGQWYYYINQREIWYNVQESSNLTQTPGSYGYETTLHEIGHALGLKHPGNYNPTAPSSR